jgi:hypothetical protein
MCVQGSPATASGDFSRCAAFEMCSMLAHMAFKEWTVLKHNPIEKLANNLWSVEGWMQKGTQRRMTVARLNDGRLIVHNAIALEAEAMKELEQFGTVAAILVPNGFHRQDSFIWKQRYPDAKIYAPKKARSKVQQIVPVDGDYDDVPQDQNVRAVHLDGMKGAEGILEVTSDSGRSVVFNDALLNMEPKSGFMGFMLGPTGRPSVPRFSRWLLVKDKRAFADHLRRTAESNAPLQRVIVGHGATIVAEPATVLKQVADEVG